MPSRNRLLISAGAAWLLASTTAFACSSTRHDPVEEMPAIEAAYTKVAATLPPEKKTKLDEVMQRIRVDVGNLGLSGYRLHEDLRGQAIEILGIKRIPRWPYEKEDALGKRAKDPIATAAIDKAKAEWKAKNYDAANATLDDAVRKLGVHVFYARC